VSSRRGLTRGAFVGAVLAVGAALAPLRPWRVLVETEPRTVAARLRRLPLDPVGARAIGAEYVRTRPGEATAAALVDAIAQSVPGGRSALAATSDGALRALLEARCRSDFAEGNTVLLRRWILSETEARLCALEAVSLGRGRSRPSRRARD
jgi:hypothetical protein